jgi:hypothetical protein
MSKSFDYLAAGLDEKVIDEILTRRRCDKLIVNIPVASLNLTPKEYKQFLKLYPPKKKTRPAGPYDQIIRNLTATINNKNLSDDHRLELTAIREHYRSKQEEANMVEQGPSKGRNIFPNYIRNNQIYDLVHYIYTVRKRGGSTLIMCCDLAAQIWNVKHNARMTPLKVKEKYWNFYNSANK